VPKGAVYAKLVLVRRKDGKLFAAPGTWRNAKGDEISAPEFLGVSPSRTGSIVDPEGDPAPVAADLQQTDGGGDAAARAPAERQEGENEQSGPKKEERRHDAG
jgi:hypothetical protein